MEITLIARTLLEYGSVEPLLNNWMDTTESEDTDADLLGEFAGRACYQSFHRPNEATRENVDYLGHILRENHLSVLEHSSMTFYVTGVSRSLLTELTRHRHLSFSVLSQRFVNEEDAELVLPPALGLEGRHTQETLQNFWDEALNMYRFLAEQLQMNGLTRKQAREAARAVLPNMTETRIVFTGNLRALREMIAKRIAPGADAEIQKLARGVLEICLDVAPNSFQDMEGLL